MHAISKIQTRHLLESFSGRYREIFFEKSASTYLSLLNGQIEPLSYSESSGFSVLSLTGKSQVFSAYGSLDQIEKDVGSFALSNNFTGEALSHELTGPEECMFAERNLSEALLPFGEHLRKLVPIAREYSFIKSYKATVSLVSRSYVIGNSL